MPAIKKESRLTLRGPSVMTTSSWRLYDTVTTVSSRPVGRFPETLRAVRESRGLTQAELAQRSGFQPSAVSHFEQGRRTPTIQNIERLADTLDVAVDCLLGRGGRSAASTATARQLHGDFVRLSQEEQTVVLQLIGLLARRTP